MPKCNRITVISNRASITVANTCNEGVFVDQDCGKVLVSQGSIITINTGETTALVSPFTALEDITAYDVVVAFGSGIRKATVTDISHVTNVVGIAITSALSGESVNIVTHGRVSNPAWSWDDTLPVYLSHVPGELLQDDNEALVNGALFSVRVGNVRDSDTVDVNIQQDILY